MLRGCPFTAFLVLCHCCLQFSLLHYQQDCRSYQNTKMRSRSKTNKINSKWFIIITISAVQKIEDRITLLSLLYYGCLINGYCGILHK